MIAKALNCKVCLAAFLSIGCELLVGVAETNAEDTSFLWNSPMPNYSETGRTLPPGVPREVDTNGIVIYVNHHFTSAAYQKEALDLVIEEANKVAHELKLQERLPITRSKVVDYHVSPFGFAYAYKMIGNVATTNYVYYVSRNYQFNQLDIADYDKTCMNLMNHITLPLKRLDTNSAFCMATNWLSQMSIDVSKLNRECIAHAAVSPYWNGLARLGETPQKQFVPIYYVWWTYPQNKLDEQAGPAGVELFAPTRTLLQLTISDPRYNQRKPVTFTNLSKLFPGVAPVHTNYPVKAITITEPLWSN